MEIVVHNTGYYENDVREQQTVKYLTLGSACIAFMACVAYFSSPASSSLFTTARPVQVVHTATSTSGLQGIPAFRPRPQFAIPSGDSMEPAREVQQLTFTSKPLHWTLAALSAAVAPMVYLYKRWAAAEEDFDEDDEEEQEQEAAWAIAAAAGEVILQHTAVLPVKDASGASVGTTELCLRTAGANSRHVIHRKLVAELANRRQSNAHTKTRGEVAGGGRKPYKQKGTGNARRGSNRSPLMRKGGVAFGPRNNKNYKQKTNKKEGRLAISSLIQNRAPLITVIRDMENSMGVISTKKAVQMIESWRGENKGQKALLLIDVDGTAKWPADHPLVKSTDNIPSVRLMSQQMVSVVDLLWPHQIFISESALERLKERFEVPEENDGEASA